MTRSLIALLLLALAAPISLAQDRPAATPDKVAAPKPAPAPTAPPPPTGGEVGTAVDAMAGSCGKALAIQAEIAAAAGKLKEAKATRQKSGAEMKKRMRAVLNAKGKVARAAKKAGTEASTLAETAKADYEAALAEGKTYEVQTQGIQTSEDQLIALVAQADEAAAACSKYEAVVRAAAMHAKRAAQEAKKHAAKARQMAAVRAQKALAAARAQQAKELAAAKAEAETARATFEEIKAEAAKQPAPATPAKPATPAAGGAAKKHATPATPAAASEKTPGKPEHAGPKPK